VAQIHPWLSLGVFLSTAATDAVYVMFNAAVFCKTPCTGGNVERGVVSVVGICSDQLYQELGIRWICRGGIVGRSFSVDDGAEQVRESRRAAGSESITPRVKLSVSAFNFEDR